MMENCELTDSCIFFNDKMTDYPAGVEAMKRDYCAEDKTSCARYRVRKALGKENVPNDLFPNEHKRADLLLLS